MYHHMMRAHDEELSRYLRGDHYSCLPGVAPFYAMEGNSIQIETHTPSYCIPNINGRYSMWHDVLVWQWGIFVGSGGNARFIQMDSFYEVMQFISPPPEDRPDLPYAGERWRRYMQPGYKDDRDKRMDRLHPNKRFKKGSKPEHTQEFYALQKEKLAETAAKEKKQSLKERAEKKASEKRRKKERRAELKAQRQGRNPRDSGRRMVEGTRTYEREARLSLDAYLTRRREREELERQEEAETQVVRAGEETDSGADTSSRDITVDEQVALQIQKEEYNEEDTEIQEAACDTQEREVEEDNAHLKDPDGKEEDEVAVVEVHAAGEGTDAADHQNYIIEVTEALFELYRFLELHMEGLDTNRPSADFSRKFPKLIKRFLEEHGILGMFLQAAEDPENAEVASVIREVLPEENQEAVFRALEFLRRACQEEADEGATSSGRAVRQPRSLFDPDYHLHQPQRQVSAKARRTKSKEPEPKAEPDTQAQPQETTESAAKPAKPYIKQKARKTIEAEKAAAQVQDSQEEAQPKDPTCMICDRPVDLFAPGGAPSLLCSRCVADQFRESAKRKRQQGDPTTELKKRRDPSQDDDGPPAAHAATSTTVFATPTHALVQSAVANESQTKGTEGEEGKKTRGAAQPKPKVSLGHLLMMVANGDLEKGELRDPWSTPLLETPPEELEECLGAYVDMDDFLTKSHEELYEAFLKLLDTHVDQEMAAATPILSLLRTKKAREVFVPAWIEWTGINGVPPLEFQYREDMPESLKAKARPIQPAVVEAATKLWERMNQYFYVQSLSPCASPIVIAPKATAPFWRIVGDYRALNKYVVIPQDVIPNVRKEIEKTKGYKVFADLDQYFTVFLGCGQNNCSLNST